MERPRIALDTKTTNLTTYQEVLKVQINEDCKGVSYFVLSIDPDPKALYFILISKVLKQNDLEITAIWSLELPHLTSGVYKGFEAGDWILIMHKSTDGTTIKSSIALAINEVVER